MNFSNKKHHQYNIFLGMTPSCWETKSLPNSKITLLCSAWNLGKENPRNFWKI